MNQEMQKVNQENHTDQKTMAVSLLAPKDLEQAFKLAQVIADSDLAPKDYRGKPGNVLIAVQMGAEVGLAPMQALQNIAVINGRPCIWGDALLAIVQASGLMEWHKEWADEHASYCETKRKGYPESRITSFSDEDARAAGLLNKQGPWTQYKARMRQMRARAFNLRDQFADVLKGFNSAEEVSDYVVEPANYSIQNHQPLASSMPRRKSEVQGVPQSIQQAPKPALVQTADQVFQESVASIAKEQDPISVAQIKRMFAIANECGVAAEKLKHFLKSSYNLDHTQDIQKRNYDEIIEWIQASREPGAEG